ncbi:hypothetical protein RchiOBHm_Chr4g0412721 [Rosa chinensis]|uniref:Secreted protein n=1 Tax=Rosa chinensis TaxID=74649 RepID=A0A2P6QVZ2_ROSCH|nr:hypothetical protein RchiOBHm_Chr4g0412721 [Rosa chinensis]
MFRPATRLLDVVVGLVDLVFQSPGEGPQWSLGRDEIDRWCYYPNLQPSSPRKSLQPPRWRKPGGGRNGQSRWRSGYILKSRTNQQQVLMVTRSGINGFPATVQVHCHGTCLNLAWWFDDCTTAN